MDPYIIAVFCVFVGALFQTVVPYILKKLDNPSLPFEYSYIVTLVISALLSSYVLIPETVEPTARFYLTMFFTGLGVDAVANKVNSTRLNQEVE